MHYKEGGEKYKTRGNAKYNRIQGIEYIRNAPCRERAVCSLFLHFSERKMKKKLTKRRKRKSPPEK